MESDTRLICSSFGSRHRYSKNGVCRCGHIRPEKLSDEELKRRKSERHKRWQKNSQNKDYYRQRYLIPEVRAAKQASINRYRSKPGIKEELARKQMLRTYGLTLEAWNELFESQQSRCAICGSLTPGTAKRYWHTDHSHITGKVRGILCHHCNCGLGSFRDNIENMKRAISYLEERESKGVSNVIHTDNLSVHRERRKLPPLNPKLLEKQESASRS